MLSYSQEGLSQPDSLPLLLPLLPLLLSLLLLALCRRLLRRRLLRHPPSPPYFPIIGHLHLLSDVPHQSLHRLSLRYGPIFSLSLGSIPCVVACSAASARQFLKTHDSSFSNRPATAAVSVLSYGSSNLSFAPYGRFWRLIRRLYTLELFSGRALDQFRPARRDELRELLAALHDKARAGEAADVGAELTRMANNVISRMAVGRRCSGTDGEAEEARRFVMETTELLGRFNVADYIWLCRSLDLQGYGKRLRDLHRRFDGFVEGIVREKEERRRRWRQLAVKNEEVCPVDFLEILLDIYEDERAEVKLTRDNVKALIRVSIYASNLSLLCLMGKGKNT